MTMLLAVDIGNSTIGLALFLNPFSKSKPATAQIPSHPVQSVAAYKKIVRDFVIQRTAAGHQPVDGILSSVVPSLNKPIIKALKEIFGKSPLIVSHEIKSGLVFDVASPEQIGADRIANAVAGFHYFKKPVAIADLGTATTITVVGKNMKFSGGSIMPGIGLMHKALHSGTAKLPLPPLKKSKTALGKDTFSAITSGIIYGTAGAIEALVKNMEKELAFRLKLALTGGHADLVHPLIKREHMVVPHLIFEGLRLIYLLNNDKCLM